MNEKMNQTGRLDYLLQKFIEDSEHYKDIEIPEDESLKKRLLRSLMNIRMPGNMSKEVLKVQDAYLQEIAAEKGIVMLSDIPVRKGNMSIWQGDITRLAVDAIVNAANSQMLGCFVPMHTCIDNQIHTFAGVQLRAECDENMQEFRAKYGNAYEQPTAIPMITEAYNLPAKKVIHIVGPIVRRELTAKLENDLADCYRNTLDMCVQNGLESVAFCCISTGVFNFPNERAAQIAVGTVENWFSEHSNESLRVIFNVFTDEDRKYYEELLC